MGSFFPTEPFGPGGEKVTKGVARAVLAVGPRHLFDLYAATWAIDSTHGVEKIDGNVPKWDKDETSLRGQMVVARASLVTRIATGFAVGTRSDEGFDANLLVGLNKFDGLINETLERMDEVE